MTLPGLKKDCIGNRSRRNSLKSASPNANSSLKNHPSDSILVILPPCMDFGRGGNGYAKRKLPIAFRVRRSRFPRLPWFDFPLGVDVSDQCHAPVLQGGGGDVAKWKMKNGNFPLMCKMQNRGNYFMPQKNSPNVQNAE